MTAVSFICSASEN